MQLRRACIRACDVLDFLLQGGVRGERVRDVAGAGAEVEDARGRPVDEFEALEEGVGDVVAEVVGAVGVGVGGCACALEVFGAVGEDGEGGGSGGGGCVGAAEEGGEVGAEEAHCWVVEAEGGVVGGRRARRRATSWGSRV